MNAPTSGIVETIRALIADAILLFKQEWALARAETEEKFQQIQTGVIAIAVGLLLAFTALLVLVQALVVALSNIMHPALASLLVGIVLAIVAFFSVRAGANYLKPENLKPSRTIKSLRDSADRFREGRSS